MADAMAFLFIHFFEFYQKKQAFQQPIFGFSTSFW